MSVVTLAQVTGLRHSPLMLYGKPTRLTVGWFPVVVLVWGFCVVALFPVSVW